MGSGKIEVGRVIERYVVESLLGEGGMASVYLVRHRSLGTPAALKVLGSVGPGAEVRLMLEGRVQAALRHPNVVAVTDVLEVDGAPGLLMEYVEPPTLSAWLTQHHPTVEEAESLFRGIVDGVRHAHRYGLVHRDLKPSNVLLARYDGGLIPKVADFGLAKILGDDPAAGQTRSGLTMGTPQYMAPEQFRDAKKVDRRADIFSLGCILYELLAGEPAFAWTDFIRLYGQIMNREYRPLSSDIPQRLRDAVEAMLEPERDARCSDCDALLALLDGRGRLANPTVSPESLPRLVEIPMLRDRLSGGTGSLAAMGETVVEPVAEPATVLSVVPPLSPPADPAPSSLNTFAGLPSVVATKSARAPAAPTMVPEAGMASGRDSTFSETASLEVRKSGRLVGIVVASLLVGGGGVGTIGWLLTHPSDEDAKVEDITTVSPDAVPPSGAESPTPESALVVPPVALIPVVQAPEKPPEAQVKPPAVARPVAKVDVQPLAAADPKPLATTLPVEKPPVEIPISPPAPAEASVSVSGDAERVVAVSNSGRYALPGKLPAGKYELLAWFPDIASAKVGSLSVSANESVALKCTAAFVQCNPVK